MAKIPESRAVQRVREQMSYGLSPLEMAQSLGWDPEDASSGYSPEWCHAVVTQFLSSFDAYTVEQQLKIAISDLQSLAAEARKNYSTLGDPRHAQQAIAALGVVAEKLQATLDRVGSELFRLDAEQVAVLVELVNKVTLRTVDWVVSQYGLEESRAEIEAQVVREIEATRPAVEV